MAGTSPAMTRRASRFCKLRQLDIGTFNTRAPPHRIIFDFITATAAIASTAMMNTPPQLMPIIHSPLMLPPWRGL
jgi:hypothetical protein